MLRYLEFTILSDCNSKKDGCYLLFRLEQEVFYCQINSLIITSFEEVIFSNVKKIFRIWLTQPFKVT